MKKILIVDDDHEVLTSLSVLLNEKGYRTYGVLSGKEAIKKVRSEFFDLILLDIVMPKMSGLDLLPKIKDLSPKTPVIIITAYPALGEAVDAIKNGAFDYISKPFRPEELFSKIGRAIEKARFEKYLDPLDLDYVFNSISNRIRRDILRLISSHASIRLTEIAGEFKIDDPSNLTFHLNLLKEGRLIEQERKAYALTPQGKKVLDCLNNMEEYLSK